MGWDNSTSGKYDDCRDAENRISELEQENGRLRRALGEAMDLNAEIDVVALKRRIKVLEEMLADCESDYRQQVDKAVELHKENARLWKLLEIIEEHHAMALKEYKRRM